jgi:hypothetical protein
MSLFADAPRLLSLTAGRAMIVTDLHGDWDAYQRYRDRFFSLREQGKADYLIFCGDLIHSEGAAEMDFSLPIVLDVLGLRQELGERLIYLLGNHEMPHLYGITLQKGKQVYTPRFEAEMAGQRPAIMALFDSLPFYARTQAGVVICHAGANQVMAQAKTARLILNYSHQRVLEEVKASLPAEQRASLRRAIAKMNEVSYDAMARELLAVYSAADPRYDDLLIGSVVASLSPDFQLLWDALFTRNEFDAGEAVYANIVEGMLEVLSAGFGRQRVVVAGHLACPGGYQIVAGRHLRLASGVHAKPYESARYLLLDLERPVGSAEELILGLGSVLER